MIQQVDPSAICVYVDQLIDGPRPDRPYSTIALFSNTPRGLGTPELKYSDDPVPPPSTRYEQTLIEHRVATLAIMVYADADVAMQMARRFEFCLWADADLDLLLQGASDEQGIAIDGPIAGPQIIPVERQVETEYPVSVDFRVLFRDATLGETDVIETVEATNQITP